MTQTYPLAVNSAWLTPANVNVGKPRHTSMADWAGGVFGDDVSQATATVALATGDGDANEADYTPRTQAAKATALGTTIAVDVTSPRGWIDPNEPYGAPPVSPTDDPTITSLTPNTAPAGAGKPPVWVDILGTKFTQWSTVETGGVPTPYSRFLSPTHMAVLMDATRSIPGVVSVKIIDHGVKSAGSNFTFT